MPDHKRCCVGNGKSAVYARRRRASIVPDIGERIEERGGFRFFRAGAMGNYHRIRPFNSRLARESWRGIRVGISRHNTSPNPCASSRSVYQIGNSLSDNESLRWHYPNQVMGRSPQLPLSLYCKLPLSSILCSFLSDTMLNVFGGNVKLRTSNDSSADHTIEFF